MSKKSERATKKINRTRTKPRKQEETSEHLKEESPLVKLLPLALVLIPIHLLLLGLLLTRHLDFLFNDAMHRIGPGTDFFAYYAAGKGWLAGEGAYGHGPGFGFRYHPAFAATVCAILSMLKPKIAMAVWVVIQEMMLLWVWRRLFVLLESFKTFVIASIILFLFSPYYIEVYMGNSSFIVGGLLLWAFELYQQGRIKSFTALLVGSIIIKPIGLVFLPILLFRKNFYSIAITILIVVLSAVPFFMAQPHSWAIFTQINLEAIHASGWVIHGGNQGFHGLVVCLCTRLSGVSTQKLGAFSDLPGMCPILLALLPFIFVLISTITSWKMRKNLGVCVFLWMAAYLLGYKDVWEHSYSFAVMGLGWLWLSNAIPKKIVLACTIWLALPTAFVLYDPQLPPGPIDPEHYWSGAVSFLHHLTKPLGVLVLYVRVCIASFTNSEV